LLFIQNHSLSLLEKHTFRILSPLEGITEKVRRYRPSPLTPQAHQVIHETLYNTKYCANESFAGLAHSCQVERNDK
jgi:hypothetical protein